MQQTIKCPICGEPYIFYSHSAADQSACPDCVAKAEKKMKLKQYQNINNTDFRDMPKESQLERFGR